jgi:DNA-binding transcriptional MerR regulator
LSSAALAAPIKSPDAFRTISEVAAELDVPQHVLRFWESRFVQIKPVKRAGGRRFYRPEDVDLLRGIRALLYSDGLTIRGVQKILKERGLRHVAGIGRGGDAEPAQPAPASQPIVIEKIVYVEKPVMAEPAPVAAPKKKPSHLRAVPRPMSLPFFDDPEVAEPVAEAPSPAVMPEVETLAEEERAKLTELLDELQGLKERLRNARR